MVAALTRHRPELQRDRWLAPSRVGGCVEVDTAANLQLPIHRARSFNVVGGRTPTSRQVLQLGGSEVDSATLRPLGLIQRAPVRSYPGGRRARTGDQPKRERERKDVLPREPFLVEEPCVPVHGTALVDSSSPRRFNSMPPLLGYPSPKSTSSLTLTNLLRISAYSGDLGSNFTSPLRARPSALNFHQLAQFAPSRGNTCISLRGLRVPSRKSE